MKKTCEALNAYNRKAREARGYLQGGANPEMEIFGHTFLIGLLKGILVGVSYYPSDPTFVYSILVEIWLLESPSS